MYDYQSLLFDPLIEGMQDSVDQMFSFMGGFLPVVLPLVGGIAFISLAISIFKGIVNNAIMDHEHSVYMDSVDDFLSDFSIFDIDDISLEGVGDWYDDYEEFSISESISEDPEDIEDYLSFEYYPSIDENTQDLYWDSDDDDIWIE